MTTRPRDNQRQRLYDAERSFENQNRSKAAVKFLTNGKKVGSTGNVHIDACQSYIDHVTTAAWFQSRWIRRKITAVHKTYGTATASTGWEGARIALPPWGRTEWVLLHEIAHHLTPGNYAPHGPEFAGVFLTLVRYQMGADAASSLRESFKRHRVRYNLKAVPKAGTREVTPRAEIEAAAKARARREREREQAERQKAVEYRERRLTGYSARKEAVATLRACIKAGMMGSVGSATRKQALATARALEKVSQSMKEAS